MLSTRLVIALIVVVVVLAVFIVWLGSRFLFQTSPNPAGPSEYSAVYTTSGDIYFGKMDWFPWPRLRNVWFLQRSLGQNNQPQFGIVPLNTAFWGPVDEIYLNPKQVIFWTRLRNDSQVAKAFANPSLLQQPSPAQAPSPGTFQGPPGPPPSPR